MRPKNEEVATAMKWNIYSSNSTLRAAWWNRRPKRAAVPAVLLVVLKSGCKFANMVPLEELIIDGREQQKKHYGSAREYKKTYHLFHMLQANVR
jgi:hypothetical protein